MATNVYQGVAKRKHITLKTKLAATLRRLGDIPYRDAKLMTEDQIISLYQFDHNILHETKHPDRDKWWNLEPLLIRAHRKKTKRDAHVIAKGRRIRAKLPNKKMVAALDELDSAVRTPKLRIGPGEARQSAYGVLAAAPRPARSRRKLRSRGFDKTLRRRMDGTVVRR